jgi:uncharacterized protein
MRIRKAKMNTYLTSLLTGAALALAATPALADVKLGVDAWAKGDYSTAVKEWRPLAIKGDADAQFNLAQAYRFGRGVPLDMKQAEDWYRKAATQGHFQAEDNLGLIMFQNGDRQNALPIIERSANRGDPRAQYVLGTALFNGDVMKKDWVRAYAMMTRASSAGLPRASESLAQMDKYIPTDQRQQGLVLARDIEMGNTRTAAQSTQPQQVAMAEPVRPQVAPRPIPQATPSVIREEALPPSRISRPSIGGALPPPPRRSSRPAPEPEPSVAQEPYPNEPLPPMTQDPYPAEPVQEAPVYDAPYPAEPAPPPVIVRRAPPVPARAAPVRATPARPAVSGKGWRVQLGAFSDQSKARALWQNLESRVSGLSGLQPYLVQAGSITRLQAGPIGSRAAAEKVCGSVSNSGNACLIVTP